MKTKTETQAQVRRLNIGWYLTAALFLMAGAATVLAEETQQTRLSTSSQGQGIERGSVGDGITTHDELDPLVTTGSRANSTRGSLQTKASIDAGKSGAAPQSATTNVDFWFFDATVELFADVDRDGYFSGLDVAIDVDTVYTVADVYSVIYLSYDLGPWNEYAVTEDFTIYGASGDDEYFVETDLVSGYPTGDYDILIELFDAYDGTFVAEIGPEDTSELAFLPLEDIGRDTPVSTTTVVVHEGGGSLGWFGLLTLFGAAGWRRARRDRA